MEGMQLFDDWLAVDIISSSLGAGLKSQTGHIRLPGRSLLTPALQQMITAIPCETFYPKCQIILPLKATIKAHRTFGYKRFLIFVSKTKKKKERRMKYCCFAGNITTQRLKKLL